MSRAFWWILVYSYIYDLNLETPRDIFPCFFKTIQTNFSTCGCTIGQGLIVFPICGWTPIPFTTTTEAPATTTTPAPILPDPECDQNSNGTLHNNLIENGHITCDNPKKCYARCDVGYIPENSANKQKIFSQVKCANNQWSDLAFTKCIKFESFCNFTQELYTFCES